MDVCKCVWMCTGECVTMQCLRKGACATYVSILVYTYMNYSSRVEDKSDLVYLCVSVCTLMYVCV